MIRLKIVVGDNHQMGLHDVPPEINLDDIVLALNNGIDPTVVAELQSAMDVPNEFVDGDWCIDLLYLQYTAGRVDVEIAPGDYVEVWHDNQLVITHWLVVMATADTDCVWASLPNDSYRPSIVRDLTKIQVAP